MRPQGLFPTLPPRHWLALTFMSVTLTSLAASQVPAPSSSPAPVELVAGGYNAQGNLGLYGLRFEPAAQRFSEPQLLAKADNPSWITLAPGRLYVANELAEGRLSAHAVTAQGSVRLLGSSATGGAAPCHVAVSPDGKFAATANYMGGSVSVFSLDGNGVPRPDAQLLKHSGKGPNLARQEAAHAHWVQWSASQALLYSVDLGLDEIKAYPFDSHTGRATAGLTALKLRPGDGPRHLFFHPTLATAYVLNELSNTVVVADVRADGTLLERQRASTLPADFTGHSQAGHLQLSADGKTLYASNRGHDSIAVFAMGEDGSLHLLQIEASRGRWPRHFLVLEASRTLLVANQESQNIVAFAIAANGTLSATGRQATLPQVTFLGELPAQP
jgi:6-phosphogluconolactonase